MLYSKAYNGSYKAQQKKWSTCKISLIYQCLSLYQELFNLNSIAIRVFHREEKPTNIRDNRTRQFSRKQLQQKMYHGQAKTTQTCSRAKKHHWNESMRSRARAYKTKAYCLHVFYLKKIVVVFLIFVRVLSTKLLFFLFFQYFLQ